MLCTKGGTTCVSHQIVRIKMSWVNSSGCILLFSSKFQSLILSRKLRAENPKSYKLNILNFPPFLKERANFSES